MSLTLADVAAIVGYSHAVDGITHANPLAVTSGIHTNNVAVVGDTRTLAQETQALGGGGDVLKDANGQVLSGWGHQSRVRRQLSIDSSHAQISLQTQISTQTFFSSTMPTMEMSSTTAPTSFPMSVRMAITPFSTVTMETDASSRRPHRLRGIACHRLVGGHPSTGISPRWDVSGRCLRRRDV